ncbi:uncharacterized protein ACBT44_004393, partial [Syngnathus typhle]
MDEILRLMDETSRLCLRESAKVASSGTEVILTQTVLTWLQNVVAADTKKESDLAKARAALDSEATERERLQVKLSKLKIDFDELEARDTKKESDLAKARAALDSEATERERLQVKLSKLKIDFDELEARDTKKESNLAKARAALDSEATERERLQVKLSKLKIDFDELEARKSHHIQILKDELEFEKKLHSA